MQSVLYKQFPKAHLVTMNREKALNSLNAEMVEAMLPIYRDLHKEPAKSCIVVLKGAGAKAFCAGGDVVSIVKDEPKGTQRQFFYREYQCDHAIATLPHAHVALWDGIVMGGGVGVSAHGSHRVASEKALFAMPETAIGLFPDVGGSWFLPRLPIAGMGMYLSLTGQRLKGADLVHAGIATNFVKSEKMSALEETLCNIADAAKVDEVIASHQDGSLPAFSLENNLGNIERHFGNCPGSVEQIVDSLKTDGSEWANKTLGVLNKCSPTSLKISLALHNEGAKKKTIAEVFEMEYFATQKVMAEHDFHAGVTALLIEKSKEGAKWVPATLGEVSEECVKSHFSACSADVPTWKPDGDFPTVSKL